MKDCDCTQCAYSKKHPQLNAPRCWHVTDEQIRELREEASASAFVLAGSEQISGDEVVALCGEALDELDHVPLPAFTRNAPRHWFDLRRADARARCAEILNAREARR